MVLERERWEGGVGNRRRYSLTFLSLTIESWSRAPSARTRLSRRDSVNSQVYELAETLRSFQAPKVKKEKYLLSADGQKYFMFLAFGYKDFKAREVVYKIWG